MKHKNDHRQIWGCGFHAGIRAAKGGDVNPSRAHALLDGVSTVARKVYDAVPIDEPWPAHKVGSEIKRMTGSHIEQKTLLGCLASLKDQRLIFEPKQMHFQKDPIKEKAPHIKLVKDEPMQPIEKPKQPVVQASGGNDKDILLTRAGSIAKSLRKTADEVEEFALDAQKMIADSDKKTKLLDQFKELFKD